MIYTGNYDNCTGEMCVSISGDRGLSKNFNGKSYIKLAPKYKFWKIWHDNLNVISKEESDRYYVHEYYNNVLKYLNPKEIYETLNNSILLCYEKEREFCNRHIVAFWLEVTLNIKVDEVKVDSTGNLIKLSRPEYIKDLLLQEMKIC